MMGLIPALHDASPLGSRQMVAQRSSVHRSHVNSSHAAEGHWLVGIVWKPLDAADQTADRKHDPCSFERRWREQIVGEGVGHAEQPLRQCPIVLLVALSPRAVISREL